MSVSKEYLKGERSQEWRTELRKKLKNKERLEFTQIKMNEVDPVERIRSNIEVNKGLTTIEAVAEARRCIDCPDPTCISGCPVEINIPKFIKRIETGDFLEAAKVLKGDKRSAGQVCGKSVSAGKSSARTMFLSEKA